MKFSEKFFVLKLILLTFFIFPALAQAVEPEIQQYYINPAGNDSNSGTSAETPFKTIQHGLDIAKPGTILNLAKGVYRETLTTKISGTETAPIIIRGADDAKDANRRYQTILYGTGRILNINHSFYQFEGFAIDGQEALASIKLPTEMSKLIAFKDANRSTIKDSKLIYIGSDDASREITGVKISNMYLRGAGGECVRIRNAAHHNEVSNSVIEYCGMFGKENGDAFTYHNGEGVYIGTSPKSTSQPMFSNDTSSYNTISNNIIHTFGSECFDVKENANHNSFVNNECQSNFEPLKFAGSNIELRGDHNLIEGNHISNSASWNLKLKSDDRSYDKGGNVIRKNVFTNAQGASIHNEASGVKFCGNTVDNKIEGADGGEVASPCEVKDTAQKR